MSIPQTNANTTNAQVQINAQAAAQQVDVAQQKAQVAVAAQQVQQQQAPAPQPQPQAAPQPVQRVSTPSTPARSSGGSKKSKNDSSAESAVYGGMVADACGVSGFFDLVTIACERKDAASTGVHLAQKSGLSKNAKTADDFFGLPTITSSLGLGGKTASKKPADDKGIHLCGSAALAGQSLGSQGTCVKSWNVPPTNLSKQADAALKKSKDLELTNGSAKLERDTRLSMMRENGYSGMGLGSSGMGVNMAQMNRNQMAELFQPKYDLSRGPKAPDEKVYKETTT